MKKEYGGLENMKGQLMGYKYRLKEIPDEQTEELYFAIQSRLLDNEEVKEFRSVLKERAIRMMRRAS